MEKKQHAAGITRPCQINPTHNTANAGGLRCDKNTRHLQNPAWLLCDLTASKSVASDSAASAPSGSLLGMQSLQPQPQTCRSRISGGGPRSAHTHLSLGDFDDLQTLRPTCLQGTQEHLPYDLAQGNVHTDYLNSHPIVSLSEGTEPQRTQADLELKPSSVHFHTQCSFCCLHTFTCQECKHVAKRGCSIYPDPLHSLDPSEFVFGVSKMSVYLSISCRLQTFQPLLGDYGIHN